MGRAEYSVYQFLKGDITERVRQFVGPEEAVKVARHYSNSVAAKTGICKRVIITDGGDEIVFEWVRGKGITWPVTGKDFPDEGT